MHLSVKLTLRLGFPHHKMPKDPQKTTALIGRTWKRCKTWSEPVLIGRAAWPYYLILLVSFRRKPESSPWTPAFAGVTGSQRCLTCPKVIPSFAKATEGILRSSPPREAQVRAQE